MPRSVATFVGILGASDCAERSFDVDVIAVLMHVGALGDAMAMKATVTIPRMPMTTMTADDDEDDLEGAAAA